MMTRRVIDGVFLLCALAGLAAAPVQAQTADDLKKSLALMQAEIDRQATGNADQDVRSAAWVDAILPEPAINGGDPGIVIALGWAWECGPNDPVMQVMIDGVLSGTESPARTVRTDVNVAFGPHCAARGLGLRPNLGVVFLLDMRGYAPGSHTVQFRLRDERGVVVKSNLVTFTKS